MTGLIESTLYLSVTAIVILLFKRIFKNKLSAKWHVLVWALLALRLVLPSLPESSFSIFNVVDIPENKVEIKNEIHADVELPKAQTERLIYGEPKNDTPQPLENTAFSETEKVTLIKPTTEPVVIQEQTPMVTSDNRQPKAKIKINIDDTVKFIYRVGAVILFVYFVCVYAVCVTRVRKNGKPADSQTASLLEECKKKTGVSRRVFAVEYGNNPMLMGLVKPTVVLPDGYTEDEKRDIIIHELCHLKGGDIYLIWLSMIVLCLNWFNPVMWLCFFVFRRDIEVYCDERVLKYVDSKKNYASLLVKTALKKNSFIAGTTSLKNSEKEVERRVKYMAYFKKPNVWWTLLLIVIAVVIGVVCLTNPVGDEKKEGGKEISPLGLVEYKRGYGAARDHVELKMKGYESDTDTSFIVRTAQFTDIDDSAGKNVTIFYPVLMYHPQNALSQKINETIKEAALSQYYEFLNQGLDFNMTSWPVNYTVEYAGENYISVLFEGYYYTKGTAHGFDVKWTVNVDLTTGEKIYLFDVFNEDFYKCINTENFGSTSEMNLDETEQKLLSHVFAGAFKEFEDNASDNFHFTNDKFHIIHSVQDAAPCFSADYKSLKPYMKDHPIWQEVDKSIPKILEYSKNFYLEEKSPNEYYCEVYDNDGQTIFTDTVEKYPLFRHLDGPLYELRTSYGTFAWESVFFDVETGYMSEVYDNTFYLDNGVIAYVKSYPKFEFSKKNMYFIKLVNLYNNYEIMGYSADYLESCTSWLIDYVDDTHISVTYYTENGQKENKKILKVPSLTGVVPKEEPKPEQLISTTTEKTENPPVTTSQEPQKTQEDPEELPTEHVAPPLPSSPEELSLGMDETFFGDIENTNEDELDVAAETLW